MSEFIDAKSFKLSVVDDSPGALIDAIHSHVSSSPFFDLVDFASGDGIVIEPKAHPGKVIAIYDDAGDIRTIVDEQGASLDASDPENSVSPIAIDPSTSDYWSTLVQQSTTNGNVWLTEYEDAILLFVMDKSNPFMRFGIHAGAIAKPARPNWPDLGLTGWGYMCGLPASNQSGSWESTSPSSPRSAQVRCGLEGSSVVQCPLYRASSQGCKVNIGNPSIGDSSVMTPQKLGARVYSSSNSGEFYESKYLAHYPASSGDSAAPAGLLFNGSDDAWLVYSGSSFDGSLVAAWEKGKPIVF